MSQYEFHHMGIPTTEKLEGERYSPKLKMYTKDLKNKDIRIQFHRFDEDCSIHPLIKSMPHVAFKVPNLEQAITGEEVILAPYFPLPGFQVAIIAREGVPIEFIETDLSDEEVWGLAENESIRN